MIALTQVNGTRDFPAARLVRDARRAWRDGGLRPLLNEVRESFVFPVFRHGRLLVIETRLDEVPALPMPEGIRIDEYRSCDWSAFSPIVPERVLARLRRASQAGRICFAAWRGDQVIGYMWVSENISHRIETYPLRLPGGAAYAWNLFVTPAERGRGVASALFTALHRHARERGYRVIWRGIDPTNPVTRRTIEKTWTPSSRIVGELRFGYVVGHAFGRMRSTDDTFGPGEQRSSASAAHASSGRRM